MPRNSGVKCLLQTVCKVLEVRTSSHSSNEKSKNPVNNLGGLRELYNTPHLWDVLTLRLHTAKLIPLLTLFFLNFKIKNYDLTAQNSPVVQTAISELDFLVFLEYFQNSRDIFWKIYDSMSSKLICHWLQIIKSTLLTYCNSQWQLMQSPHQYLCIYVQIFSSLNDVIFWKGKSDEMSWVLTCWWHWYWTAVLKIEGSLNGWGTNHWWEGTSWRPPCPIHLLKQSHIMLVVQDHV